MRIFHVLRSTAWGGLELYTLDFIQKQQSILGFQNTLLCHEHSKVWLEAKKRNIKVQNTWAGFQEADILHIHRRKDLPAARLRLVGRSQRFFYSLYMSAPAKKGLYHRWIYSRIEGLASSSKWVCENVRHNFPIPSERIHCVRYGRDSNVSLFNVSQIEDFRRSRGVSRDEIVLCSMSRIDPEKGVGLLVDAFLKLKAHQQKKLRLWIMGDPTLQYRTKDGKDVFEPESERLFKLLQNLHHPQIELIPFQSDPENFLQSADLFFLGSTEETYSLAVIDAFLRAKPVLGSRSGGTIEQIFEQATENKGEERGYFFEPRDEASLIQGLQEILETDFREIQSRGQRARAWALREHDWKRCLETWEKIYSSF